jgi:hypothetical protein
MCGTAWNVLWLRSLLQLPFFSLCCMLQLTIMESKYAGAEHYVQLSSLAVVPVDFIQMLKLELFGSRHGQRLQCFMRI